MSKLLTISIPTYNRASMLDDQLQWLSMEIEGRENDCEIVVSDNCSSDNTPEVIARWQQRFEGRVTFRANRHDHNIGGMANIAHCIGQATSDFVWSLGDDDPIQKGTIRYILGKIEEHPSLSLILLNGCGVDKNTHQVLQERWFESTSDKPSKNSISEFEVFLEKHMGGVLFISSAVYKTKLVHRAFKTWPDSAKNMASQAYWVAYCAARGSFIVTPNLFTECAMGIGFTDKDPKWMFNLIYRGIPEVYIRLMKAGYSRKFCFYMLSRNLQSATSWRVFAGGLRRWPGYAASGLGYYVKGLMVGLMIAISYSQNNREFR